MITVKVGFQDKRAVDKYRTIGAELKPQMRKSMEAIKDMLKRDLYMMAPVGKTGRLRAGFNLNLHADKSGGHELLITNKMPYFVYVHEGTQPHDMYTKAYSSNGGITGRLVHHPGISRSPKPGRKGIQPFVTRILHVRQKLMAETLAKGLVNLVESGRARDLPPINYFPPGKPPSRYVYTYQEGFKRRANREKVKLRNEHLDSYGEGD